MTTPRIPRGMVPLVSGYAAGPTPGVQRTGIEGGPARYALAYDRGMQTYAVALKLSTLQFSVWNVFYHRAILKGAVSFALPMDSGHGVSDHVGNMLPDTYSATRLQGNRFYLVSFQFEVENQAYEMTDADAEALLEVYETYGDETDALLRRLARFALVDTLVLDF